MSFSGSLARATLAAALIGCASCSRPVATQQNAPPPAPMFAAFEVAFGKPAPYATIDDSGDHVVYRPQALVALQPGVVALISKREIPGGCKACAGGLSVNYLRSGPGGFSRLGAWPNVGGEGEFGGVLPWTIRTDLDNQPTVETTRTRKEGACSSATDELITLTPSGPVKIATVVLATAYDAQPAYHGRPPHVSGTIKPIVRGESFSVVLKGTDPVRQTFRRQGDVFTTYDPGATGC